MLARIRERFAAARAGDGAELEQALIRIANVSVAYLYFLWAFFSGRLPEHTGLLLLVIGPGAGLASIAVLGWVLAKPGANPPRRRAFTVVDMGGIALVMLYTEEVGTMLYPFYLWGIIGAGFRFGRPSLRFAQILAVAGFLAVLVFNRYWHEHLILAAAFLLGLVAIPFYVSMLVSRLNAARSEAEAANMAKTKFLAAASHDLRQPMQALSMYASVLEEQVSGAGALRVVRGIELSVRTLEQLFDSLLDISKIESGVIKPCVASFPLMPLIEQVVEAERPLAAQKGLELRTVRTSAWAQSDPALLERMLKNLVTNAIRYTERGGIVIGCRRAGATGLRVEVVDSGIGIESQEHQRIFDDYYQVGGASGQGLGLGLPIVKSLGELLGHKVAVRSALGRGSVFSIELERSSEALAPAAAAVPQVALSGARVVLVDDDVEIRDSMRLLLEGWACSVVSGGTLGEVEDKLRRQRLAPDALIVDYRLATMTGLQVIDQLRATHGKQLAALIITGTANLTLLQQRALGIPVALKPVPPGKLRAFLAQALQQSEPADPLPSTRQRPI